MNFFTINHSLCTSCNECIKACPTNAINTLSGSYSIDYSKCIACGTCFKSCGENAIKLDIPKDKINAAILALEASESRLEELNTLTSENRSLNEKMKQGKFLMRNLVNNLGEAIVIIGENREVLFYNDRFISMLDKKSRIYYQHQVLALEGKPIEELISNELLLKVLRVYAGGNDLLWDDTQIGDSPTNVSIYSLRKGEAVMLVFRNIEDPKVASDIAIKLIEDIIDKNMAMVNKIGFILGEDVAGITKTLFQTIKTIDPKFNEK